MFANRLWRILAGKVTRSWQRDPLQIRHGRLKALILAAKVWVSRSPDEQPRPAHLRQRAHDPLAEGLIALAALELEHRASRRGPRHGFEIALAKLAVAPHSSEHER